MLRISNISCVLHCVIGILLLNDASKTAAHELSNVDGVPCGEVVEVVVPARDLQQQHQQ